MITLLVFLIYWGIGILYVACLWRWEPQSIAATFLDSWGGFFVSTLIWFWLIWISLFEAIANFPVIVALKVQPPTFDEWVDRRRRAAERRKRASEVSPLEGGAPE